MALEGLGLGCEPDYGADAAMGVAAGEAEEGISFPKKK